MLFMKLHMKKAPMRNFATVNQKAAMKFQRQILLFGSSRHNACRRGDMRKCIFSDDILYLIRFHKKGSNDGYTVNNVDAPRQNFVQCTVQT